MMKKRSFIKNNHAITNTIESLIAIGITITLVFAFCYSIDTHYNAYDNKTIILKTQGDSILGNLISLQGLNRSYGADWENGTDPINELRYLGFATNPTIEYGVINKSNSKITDGPYPKNYVGQTGTCFLAGTKTVMADGTYKDIETIVVGDTVKSFNEKNRQMEDKKVTKISHHAPEEMGDYYLIMNKFIRVTPNHQFYTEKGWITADGLKIGDKLSYSSDCNVVYSIEKVYEKVETYNFEVEGNHNYFVVFDSKEILAHNSDTDPGDPGGGPEEEEPSQPSGGSTNVTDFTWFDQDGLYTGKVVYFKSTSNGSITSYNWANSSDNGETYTTFSTSSSVSFNVVARSYIRLQVTRGGGAFGTITSLIKIVEANKLNAEPDPDPWVLTGKNTNPDADGSTLSSYGEGYYVTYYETSPTSNYRVYAVKEKKSPDPPILSRWKIQYVTSLSNTNKATLYNNMKGWLGLTSEKSIYNFNITIYEYDGVRWNKILNFGASDNDVNDKVSVTRQVSIYTPPSGNNLGKIIADGHPKYRDGKIIISTFIGGSPP